MKILHGMTDIAGQASFSVNGLKYNKDNAKLVVWRKNPFCYGEDLCLNIGTNKLFYPWYALKVLFYGIYAMFKYDVFHFHFTRTLLPYCLDLPILKLMNKKVFIEYHGSDIRWVFNKEKTKYWPEEESLPLRGDWLVNINKRIAKYTDNIVLHDSELIPYLYDKNKNIYMIPLKINVDKLKPNYPSLYNEKIVIVHAPSNKSIKGSKFVNIAVEKLQKKYNIEYIQVEGKSQLEALDIYKKADIIVDQLIMGMYGVFAIEGMALGKPVVCYIKDEIISDYPQNFPIVNANPINIEEKLEELIKNSELRYNLGVNGRKYAENYHDYKVIAKAQKKMYEGKYPKLTARESFNYIKSLKEEG